MRSPASPLHRDPSDPREVSHRGRHFFRGLVAPGQCAGRVKCGMVGGMCRNIRVLNNFEPPATEDEIEAAALQYVRKVSGMTKPAAANEEAVAAAVQAVAEATRVLLDS